MNGPTTPIVEVAGTWAVAVQASKHSAGNTDIALALVQRSNCTEAQAIKEALEVTLEAKPNFSIDQWLTTFIPAATSNAPSQVPGPISNERGDE